MYTKKHLSKLKKLFSSLDFVDDIHKDPLTGGDGHLDGIKAYLYNDYFSIRWSTFKIGSLGAVAAHWFKDPAQYLPYEFESLNNSFSWFYAVMYIKVDHSSMKK